MLRHLFKKSDQIRIFQVYHSSIVIEWKGKTIYIDPTGDPAIFQSYPAPDLVLVTDANAEHFDIDTLKGINLKSAELVAPEAVFNLINHEINIKNYRILNHGESLKWHKIRVEAIPAIRQDDKEDENSVIHEGNGYLVGIRNKRIYISGETEKLPAKSKLKNIDIAFICLKAKNKENIQHKADAVLDFKPRVVYPYLCPEMQESVDNAIKFKSLIHEKNEQIEVRIRDWYSEN